MGSYQQTASYRVCVGGELVAELDPSCGVWRTLKGGSRAVPVKAVCGVACLPPCTPHAYLNIYRTAEIFVNSQSVHYAVHKTYGANTAHPNE